MHIPVLSHEAINMLSPEPGKIYLDATFGGGSYTKKILDVPDTKVIAFDKDPDAIKRAYMLKEKYPMDRLTIVESSFNLIAHYLKNNSISCIDGIVYDLGVSSFQIDQPQRGFSFRFEGPLDMRMTKTGQSAADVINHFSEKDLANIFYIYGEEKKSYRIARAIVEHRKNKPFETTLELANLITRVLPSKKNAQHPATLVFQGLRIFINNELIEIKDSIKNVFNLIAPKGKIVTVTFHSLEDRLVKTLFKECTDTGQWINLSKKPVKPSEREMAENPRSRSAKLRGIAFKG